MALIYEVLSVENITNEQLTACSALFNTNYGVWAPNAPSPLKPGTHVKNSAAKLRKEYLTDTQNSVIVTCTLDGQLVGHACVTKWKYQNGYVGWVTQLVVDGKERRRYIATSMLQMLKRHRWFENVIMMGIASSHPASCNVLCKLFNGNTKNVDLGFIVEHAQDVLNCSTVEYLRTAELGGAFKGTPDGSYLVNTSFFVDHTEPKAILRTYVAEGKWAFGELIDGHEFLVLIAVPKVIES
ncbi:hypothetical protein C8Q70DRAFT_1011308 [Cubamyces menziesii]|uniref:N-acetyltransferase domain-containing protein n=1 Tax=Trametes cubensis TaxID=1111947 RepID=A0AAD7XDB9_9APHY|nr:hypothetical protein C8Q70DRAFT_1011308 [Cubamyces menziesii]KAJ8488367.1 hypothetical protein ONZ51_g3625 [Trametes cubensis]